jgi:NAD(P)-dependent dehydrogenase (short-subunit alcohol dehydrogenase family)
MADHSIKGKTVLIAGGAKNLGGLLARDLAEQGAKAVAIHYNSAATKDAADETIAAIQAAGAQAAAFQGDLTSAGAIEKLFADTIAAVGSPDIAINTVGKVLKKPFVEISEAEYDEMTAVNSKSAFFFLKEAGRHVNDNGKIVTLVTSLLGAFTPFYAAYAGTKAPVEHFTRAASKEFGERGISVTAIGPGPMGHAVLLSGRRGGRGGLSQDGGGTVRLHQDRADRYRGHCALHPVPCLRWLVDDRTDDSCERRLHDQVTHRPLSASTVTDVHHHDRRGDASLFVAATA